MRFIQKIHIYLFANLLVFPLFAQNGNSPYSRLGIGELSTQGNIYNMGMGGLSVSNSSQAYLNISNPALLVRNRVMVFETGFGGEYKQITSTKSSEKNSNGNLAYVAFGLPLSDRWTMSLGIRPLSNVNYVDRFEIRLPRTPSFVEYVYKGSGGITQAFMAHGVRVAKGFSLGGQVNYNFGSIYTESVSTVIDNKTNLQGSYAIAIFDQTTFSDFSYKAGAIYTAKLDKNTFLNFAATYDLEANLNIKRFKSIQRRDISGQILSSDTISQDLKSSIALPAKTSFGISLEKPFKYTFGVDIAMQDWSKFTGLIVRDTLASTYKITVGGEYTPNLTSINSYLARISYRAGFSYMQLPYKLEGQQLDEKSLHLGFSMPLNRGYSALNLAFTLGQRGVAVSNLLQETFFRVNLGFTVNDAQWFFRRKIN
ncbi:MAG: hypothetical protein EAZ08_05515 [Cytophagales bacterium]|nr:MAG: hypothetical protein EAZ08_05515 [Cytophagales bacterium]